MPETPRSALLVVEVVVDPADEAELHRWYDDEHIPEKRATPGFRSARRFAHASDPGRFLAVYEVDDPDVVTSPAYMSQPLSAWTESVMASWRTWSRDVWVEITRA